MDEQKKHGTERRGRKHYKIKHFRGTGKKLFVLSDEQAAIIKENLFYNYYILYCAIRAFGLEDKLLGVYKSEKIDKLILEDGEPIELSPGVYAVEDKKQEIQVHYGIAENEFIRVMIEDALAYKDELKGKKPFTLMDRLYQKNDEGKYMNVTRKASTEDSPSAKDLVDRLIELFGFDKKIWLGQKGFELGITMPDDVRLGSDDLTKHVNVAAQFKNWCSKLQAKYDKQAEDTEQADDVKYEYSIELYKPLVVEKISDILKNKKAAYKNICNYVIHDPMVINPVYAYIYTIVSGELLRNYPGFIKVSESYKLFNFDALVDYINYMINGTNNVKKKELLLSAIKETKRKSGLSEGKSEYRVKCTVKLDYKSAYFTLKNSLENGTNHFPSSCRRPEFFLFLSVIYDNSA